MSALQDRFWAIRVHAARLYGERFTENEYVLVLMATQDSDERVRVTAINILNDMNKLNQDLFILLLHDNNPRVHRSVLMIMLGMDVDQIPPSVKTEAYKIFTSTAENEKKDFTKLYQEIIKKILPTTAVKGASPNERN